MFCQPLRTQLTAMKRSYFSTFNDRDPDLLRHHHEPAPGGITILDGEDHEDGDEEEGEDADDENSPSSQLQSRPPPAPGNEICDECSKVNFAAVFNRGASLLPQLGKRISTSRHALNLDQGCWFCDAAMYMIGSLAPPESWHWRALPSSWYHRKIFQQHKQDQYVPLVVAILDRGVHITDGMSTPTSGGFIVPTAHTAFPSARHPYDVMARPVQMYVPDEVYQEFRDKTWSTRAWCYQEGILSPQSLVFTEFQTHLVCKDLIYQESSRPPISVNCAYLRDPFLTKSMKVGGEAPIPTTAHFNLKLTQNYHHMPFTLPNSRSGT